jgi:hypothetical protein
MINGECIAESSKSGICASLHCRFRASTRAIIADTSTCCHKLLCNYFETGNSLSVIIVEEFSPTPHMATPLNPREFPEYGASDIMEEGEVVTSLTTRKPSHLVHRLETSN